MSQRKISRLETEQARITPEEIEIYCSCFNVSADYLLGFSDELKPFSKR
ncbi:MAG: helix-turn-helix transcriptional regulator [Eubacterium sp.]|nr:helix-turn-helix transcriptional regulator [Eubacterium sp.]